jgi:predicted nucleic acid-binding protein
VSVLVDTNVLLRRTQPGHPHYNAAVESVIRLVAAGEPVHYTLQNVAEFWNALTRPVANNGLGLSVVRAEVEIVGIEETLTLLPDVPAIYAEWRRLVTQHGVLGAKVHDARLVAAMNVHGVTRLLTFNAGDFARYGIEVLQPAVISGAS